MKQTVEKYDLVVIGSGPGGEKGAAQAAFFGKKVAMIEKESVLGGAAANTGTLPSKTLRESSLFLSGFNRRQLSGLTLQRSNKVTVGTFLTHERAIKEAERQRIDYNMLRHDVQVYKGTAGFIDQHTIMVRNRAGNEFEIQGDIFLIATGSYPRQLPNIPYLDDRIYDSDSILNLHSIPDTMLVIGGGVIGCEYACTFNELGTQVILVEGRDRILGALDTEIAKRLEKQMIKDGMRVMLEDRLEKVEPEEERVQIILQSEEKFEVDAVLISAGRCSRVEDLNLDKIGVETGKRGLILVDDKYCTNVSNIYAVGDVIGFPALASTSMEQGRIAMVHAFNLKYKTHLATILPYGIYTIPECSMAGATEEELQEAGTPYVVGRSYYNNNARGQIIGDIDGMVKLLFRVDDGEEDMCLLGVHIVGEQATELIHIGLSGLLLNSKVDLFINTCYNYPTLSEMYKYAAYDALGQRARYQKPSHAKKKTA